MKDADLDRKAFLSMVGKEVSTAEFPGMVILQWGNQHLKHIRAAAAA